MRRRARVCKTRCSRAGNRFHNMLWRLYRTFGTVNSIQQKILTNWVSGLSTCCWCQRGQQGVPPKDAGRAKSPCHVRRRIPLSLLSLKGEKKTARRGMRAVIFFRGEKCPASKSGCESQSGCSFSSRWRHPARRFGSGCCQARGARPRGNSGARSCTGACP